ncbi:mandelate racemase/muconate lactonizing enzyme family protein [Clostridium sp. AM22-11AC]|uniref:mandelate racemase/muconate lactonizing enzyme family protein n=1 Tax=Clostridium sp. AM22-11AC TaxID=2293024 RepID=UPI000E4B155B|nr:mandelate racemase/muconate lactonizing enzyme family protein [Clostridium sp. AM22-11AC]RHO08698.1 mandelate racemase/muconate lactonizing enzyme family protein [Clostridium sp. AM22-11AC]
MKITDIKTIKLHYPYKSWIVDGCGSCGARGAFLIFIETDTELTGIGEAATFGSSMEAMESIVEKQLKPLLLEEDPSKIEFLHQKMLWNCWANGRQGMVMGAISGIDVALWDLLGKAAKLPVCKLLGQVADRVQGYASAGFYAKGKSLEDLQKEIEGYLDRGFTAFKMKIGRTANNYKMRLQYMKNGDFYLTNEEDKARIELVRRTIGPDKTLMVDMNCTWDVDDVLRARSFFEKNDIFMIEEPTRSDDIAGYRRLTREMGGIRVAGIESEQGVSRFGEMIATDTMDVVQASLGWAGGFTGCRKIASTAQVFDKLYTPHSFFSAVMTAANIQFAASQVNIPFIEAEENENPLRTELLRAQIETDGHMNYLVTDKPGLGIELNWDVVDKYMMH